MWELTANMSKNLVAAVKMSCSCENGNSDLSELETQFRFCNLEIIEEVFILTFRFLFSRWAWSTRAHALQ